MWLNEEEQRMQAVIVAGGKGTRLSEITKNEIPKPMVKVNGRPILEHQMECLKRNGISDFILMTGYLGEQIEEYFGDGECFGIHITYVREEEPLGTAGALFYIKNVIKGDFLLILGDLIFDICVEYFYKFHKEHDAKVTLLVHPNDHPYDSDILMLGQNNEILSWNSKNDSREFFYKNLVNAGIYMLNSQVLDYIKKPEKTDLETDIIFPMIAAGDRVYGYRTSEYVKDAGTPERLHSVEYDLFRNLVHARNLAEKQKCIFLDRDGTVNKYKGLLWDMENLELEDQAGEAIKAINQSGYLVIIITNQPVVARGLCTIEDLERIHDKLETLLGQCHAYVDGIKYCPHHPDKGYPEENPEYKIKCSCRKPSAGLILECADAYHIDLKNSWIIGDTTVDIQAGINAGLHTALVKSGIAGADHKYGAVPELVFDNLLEAVLYIINRNGG